MIHLFLDASAASSGSGPTYVRNVIPQLAARADARATILISPRLRNEFQDRSNISFAELAGDSGNAPARFFRSQWLIPKLIRRSGANVLISAGNMALFRSPVPQILLSGNALYTSSDFIRDLTARGDYKLWLDTVLKSQIAKWSVQAADCTIAPSQSFADELQRWTGINARAIHHGFDRTVFFHDADPLPSSFGDNLRRDGDELRLLFVSHYNYYRNFETLIRAVALLRRIIAPRKIRLFLTCRLTPGENPGSYRTEAAENLVRHLGVNSNVVQLGAVPYHLLHHVYRACDIYVTPAYVETFAHPLIEAMASGLPVVASDLAVHREVCADAASYFPAFSPELLADTVHRVALSPQRLTRMSQKGLQRSQDFSWKHHVARVISIAQALASSQFSEPPEKNIPRPEY